MKLRPEDLTTHLAGTLLPVYLVIGESPLLSIEASDAIRVRARAAGFTEREVFHIDRPSANAFQGAQHAAEALSLFASRRVLEIRMPGGKPGHGEEALVRILDAAGDDLLVLVLVNRLEREAWQSDWVRRAEQRGASIGLGNVDVSQLPDWLRRRFRAAGLVAEPEAIALLVERTEGNLLAAKQEIEKLRLLAEPGPLDAQALAGVVADSARYTAFDLCDRAFEGDLAAAARTLAGLRAEGEEPLAVLGAMTWEIRRLLAIAERHAGGEPLERAVESQRGGKRHYASAVRRLGGPGLHGLLLRAGRVDRGVKGLGDADPWDELLSMVIDAAGGLPRAARGPTRADRP